MKTSNQVKQELENELEVIKLIEESEKLPAPIFSFKDDRGDFIFKISKVTPKRIYIRKIKKESLTVSEEFIKRDNCKWNLYGINIPETVKVWEKYMSNNKT